MNIFRLTIKISVRPQGKLNTNDSPQNNGAKVVVDFYWMIMTIGWVVFVLT